MPTEVIWELWYVPYEKILHYGMDQNLVHLLINYGREVHDYNTGMVVRGQLLKFGSCLPLVEAGSLAKL